MRQDMALAVQKRIRPVMSQHGLILPRYRKEHQANRNGMKYFDRTFFNELGELSDVNLLCTGGSGLIPLDGRPSDSEIPVSFMQSKGKLSDAFVNLTASFVADLAVRSNWRLIFERDFHVRPYQAYSHSKGRSGRKQLHIHFEATPPGRLISRDWGVSVGLGFDLLCGNRISQECVIEYENFWFKVSDEPALFNETFLELGGYAEPVDGFSGPATAEIALKTIPNILQPWLFYGKRISFEEILRMGTLQNFTDECIRIFDRICEAGYYDHV